MKRTALICLALFLGACENSTDYTDSGAEDAIRPSFEMSNYKMPHNLASDNPFAAESELAFHFPPFDKISIEHYRPAFEAGMEQQMAEIDAIANSSEDPSFENTFIAMEASGEVLDRSLTVFYALTSADTNDDLEAIQSEMAPKLSAHRDKIMLNGKLFGRIKSVYDQLGSLDLDSESKRLVTETYERFARVGAQLPDADKEKLKAFNSELAELQTQFSQNVLKEVNAMAVLVESKEDLTGMTDRQITAAAKRASDAGMEGKYQIALLNTSTQPLLASLENRATREKIYKASVSRGSRGGEFDNREILTKVARIRAERAKLLGFDNHAAYSLQNQTAKTTKAVNDRLAMLAPAAVKNAEKEAKDLQAAIAGDGHDFELAAWDWQHYTEKVRKERFDLDEAQLQPYLELDNVLKNGVFHAAEKVFGITFEEVTGQFPVYHPDVRVFNVFDEDGSQLAMFIGDFYERPSKRGGAWMNAYVSQSGLMDNKPVVANHQNITKPSEGEATLMTFTEVITMFHEFGHALHGMFSDVNYPSFAGTSVPRDFVEYPSQVNEMWATWPSVLANYARHYETGEKMPQELVDKFMAAQKFNQGFATTEYLAASLLDQAWHQLEPGDVPEADGLLDFEAKALEDAGVSMAAIAPRYRSTYFSHIIGGYSAGYYSYIWSEVLDADTVEWFKENGGLQRENGDHFRKALLSRGGSEDAMTIFQDFRGAEPNVQHLLDRRGLN